MNLILWRHAQAEPGMPDLTRPLTPKGHKQAAAMARWLHRFLPADARILVSPATRTRQTADALKYQYEIAEGLAPDQPPEEMLRAAHWPDAGQTVVLVGHNPSISRLAALLLSGHQADWAFKKGAAWCFAPQTKHGDSRMVLKAVMSPDIVETLFP